MSPDPATFTVCSEPAQQSAPGTAQSTSSASSTSLGTGSPSTLYGDHAECYSKVEEAEGKLKRLMEQLEELYQMANELKRGAETDRKRLLEQLGKEQAKWEITKTELEQKVETLESKVQELRVVLKSNVAMEADPDSTKQELHHQAEEHDRQTSETSTEPKDLIGRPPKT